MNTAKRILLVEEDAAIASSLLKVLQGAGWEVTLTSSTGETAGACGCREIDLLLLDLDMPSEANWAFLAELFERNPEVPVLLLTGLATAQQKALAQAAGALLEKPVEAPLLLDTIYALITHGRQTSFTPNTSACGVISRTGSQLLQNLRETVSTSVRFIPPRRNEPGTRYSR